MRLLLPMLFVATVMLTGPVWADTSMPMETDPLLAPVIDLLSQNDAASALQTLEKQLADIPGDRQPIHMLVLRAHLLENTGNNTTAGAAWLEISRREKSLQTYAGSRSIACHVKAGTPDAAEAVYNAWFSSFNKTDRIRMSLLIADGYRRAGEYPAAEKFYRKVLSYTKSSYSADDALLGLALSQSGAAKPEDALDTLRALKINFRNPDVFERALTEERKISAGAKIAIPALSENQYLSIYQRLRDRSRFADSLEILDDWRSSYPDTKRAEEIEHAIIETLYRMRQNSEALARCELFRQTYPDSKLNPSVVFHELRLYQRLGDTDKVCALGGEIWDGKHGGSRTMQINAAYVVASYLVSVGRVNDGLEMYRSVYKSISNKNSKNDILWRVGIGALRDDQFDRSSGNLRLLLSRKPTGEQLPSTLYWLAVAEDKVGNPKTAIKHLLRLENEFTHHYYGIRARMLLVQMSGKVPAGWLDKARKDVAEKPLEFPDTELKESTRSHRYLTAARILASAGLHRDAADFTYYLLLANKRDPGAALLAARSACDSGQYKRSVQIISDFFKPFTVREATGLPEDFWQLYYPKPFWNEIRAAALKHEVDPYLMVSLMRQESRFDPRARSQVGAIGLFQIMPYTAEEIGPRAGVGIPAEQALYQPDINARIAARLAADLLDYFDSYAVPTIASYNAGEDRVFTWWQVARNAGVPEDLFVDTIPYSETRGFVRAVLTNYFSYGRIYSESAAEKTSTESVTSRTDSGS